MTGPKEWRELAAEVTLSAFTKVTMKDIIEALRTAATAVGQRDALLREARAELYVIGSYVDDLTISVGLRATAKAYNNLIARIDTLLAEVTNG